MDNNNGQGDDFNTLVEDCAGPDRKEQVSYLSRVVMKVMIDRFDRDLQLPDANVLRVCGIEIEEVVKAMKVLDALYSGLSKSLLDDADKDPCGIRLEAQKYMRKDLNEREKIQKEAGILKPDLTL